MTKRRMPSTPKHTQAPARHGHASMERTPAHTLLLVHVRAHARTKPVLRNNARPYVCVCASESGERLMNGESSQHVNWVSAAHR